MRRERGSSEPSEWSQRGVLFIARGPITTICAEEFMQQTTRSTRSRLPFIAIGVWAALLIGLVAISFAFGNRPANAAAGAGGDPNQANLIAPLQVASPSASASAAPSD